MDYKEIKTIFKDLLERYLSHQMSKDQVVDELIHVVNCEAIYESDELLITDCFFALYHLTEENISEHELNYFLKCLKQSETYNLENKLSQQ